ncbi:MAG: ferritin-like domain-containing protein [Myxococcota bacterium]|nr:ferritin-like domain-containing protein [Deltaproteobacteria bacterium]MDQ3340197.1 ferritin-like domain-containing protein [Myxococcota bacterium]
MIVRSTKVALFRRFVAELEGAAPRDAPDLSAYDDAAREAARFAWATRIVDEYRSVAVFAELLRLLTDLEASYPAQCAVHRLIGDELRHTELTTRVVEWLGGLDGLAIDLADVGLPPRDASESALVRALHIIGREIVVTEEESIYALAAYRNATTEPSIRAVLDEILVDEVRHAAVGRALMAELVGRLDDAEQARLEGVMREDRAHLREVYLASARGGAGRTLGGSIERADLEAIWRKLRRGGVPVELAEPAVSGMRGVARGGGAGRSAGPRRSRAAARYDRRRDDGAALDAVLRRRHVRD